MSSSLGQPATQRLTPQAADTMRRDIEEAGGHEVFFVATLDEHGKVSEARAGARGHSTAVPALLEQLKTRDVVIHNHPGGDLTPSDADLELAAVYGRHGHGVYIVNNSVERVYVVVEPFTPNKRYTLDPDALKRAFRPAGKLARLLPEFEIRPQQVAMMEAVARAFNEDGVGVIEAPTGVGKTLAYLIPAVLWAINARERVVVATKTINLQEQIIFKDIPVLDKCIGKPFSAVLVKGRGNYLCLRKLERAFSEATLFEDENDRAMLEAIAAWSEKTSDGSLSDLPFVPPRDLWDRVCSEADTCLVSQCPSVKGCFVTKARREVAKADIIVANHHMLFSDLAIKQELGSFTALAVLPAYKRVIFDEAHNVEDSATAYFGVETTRNGAMALLSRFYRQERTRERGLLPYLKLKIMKEYPQLGHKEFESFLDIIDNQLLPAITACRHTLDTAFGALRALTSQRCGQIGREIKWRITGDVLAESGTREIHESFVAPALNELETCAEHCDALLDKLHQLKIAPDERESPLLTEMTQLRAYRERLRRVAVVMAECLAPKIAPNSVRWIEIDSRNPHIVRVARCPLDVGQTLSQWVYPNLQTVVMTSATLTVRREFDYLFTRIGLDRVSGREVNSLALDSPFDFEEQALLCIPTDINDPDAPQFLEESAELIAHALKISHGCAFVLFTSFRALDVICKRCEEGLRRAGITPLRQGSATRTYLLDRFREDKSSVLFATDSFWEGVDVAGEALQCVILTKLPFRVPTEPILQARAEAIESAGGNSFMAYTVPQAVIKFRQGFGRLIRRKSDRGVILVLDRRILTRHYGRLFLESLPGVPIISGAKRRVLAALQEFFPLSQGD